MRFLFPRKQIGAVFVHPLDPAPKTVMLAAGFQSTRAIRAFPEGWSDETARLCPCALAAPMKELRRLARAGIELRHAVIVLTRGAESCLAEEERELLWRAFGVPVFEQCLGAGNKLLAAECEAHDGLHVMSGPHDQLLETAVCGCGSSIPRLMRMPQALDLERMYALVS
ncbi:MAG: hypothetical protein ACR2NN_28120 [Bryobacteraceae bacterium]